MFCFQEARLKAQIAENKRELERHVEEKGVLKEICSNANARMKQMEGDLAATQEGILHDIAYCAKTKIKLKMFLSLLLTNYKDLCQLMIIIAAYYNCYSALFSFFLFSFKLLSPIIYKEVKDLIRYSF